MSFNLVVFSRKMYENQNFAQVCVASLGMSVRKMPLKLC